MRSRGVLKDFRGIGLANGVEYLPGWTGTQRFMTQPKIFITPLLKFSGVARIARATPEGSCT